MEKTWKPKAAGILSIIGGICGIVAGSIATATIALFQGGMEQLGGGFIALGVIALIGGIMSLKRKVWGLGMAGAICALFPVVPLGILAIIFVSMGKEEFK